MLALTDKFGTEVQTDEEDKEQTQLILDPEISDFSFLLSTTERSRGGGHPIYYLKETLNIPDTAYSSLLILLRKYT